MTPVLIVCLATMATEITDMQSVVSQTPSPVKSWEIPSESFLLSPLEYDMLEVSVTTVSDTFPEYIWQHLFTNYSACRHQADKLMPTEWPTGFL